MKFVHYTQQKLKVVLTNDASNVPTASQSVAKHKINVLEGWRLKRRCLGLKEL